MAQFLLEILSEEVPSRMQRRATEDLQRLICGGLEAAGIDYDNAYAFATPRRLALLAYGLPQRQPDVREERKGPRADAPDKAIEGFLRATGLERDQLETRDTPKGPALFAVIERPGRETADVLAEVVAKALAGFPWPKSMRWGSYEVRWVRPIHSILALFDRRPVALSFGPIVAGQQSRGHRFLAPAAFEVSSLADYREKLAAARVILDADERRALIRERVEALANAEGLALVHHEGLLQEVVGLAEWPVVLMGRIDADFMDLPLEVLTTAMRTHQKYFSLLGPDGRLAPHFIFVADNESADPSVIVAGNERVLRARLADAKFFWDQDRKVTLESRLPALDDIVFHARLGSLRVKAERIAELARFVAETLGDTDADAAEHAGRLAKADLSTEMVGEFPELQGVMGCHYARQDGLSEDVARAIGDHYAPQGPGDSCPTDSLSVAVALADKVDTLIGFFAIDEKPSGSKDPFALRRTALGIIRLILQNGIRLDLRRVLGESLARYAGDLDTLVDAGEVVEIVMDFFADRLQVYLRGEGVRHDLIAAAFALRENDLVRLLARVEALSAFLDSDDGSNLLTAYRRANNIVEIEEKKDGRTYERDELQEELLSEEAEQLLSERLNVVNERVGEAVAEEDFQGACRTFATLRQPVDRFFDEVTVNVAGDEPLRQNRLRLLDKVRVSFLKLADFSQIEG
ncbi:MAG: glycine--tRNA ligase subunit beta [Alphaproteobacteria bacterium]|nr:glycine--tRNA ligase subunit beta [Alphaproteobacteria bacterium]MDP6622578.1 glycine--tRNA ligase subunit beta [Alphaproteobacteria bacterium]